MSTTTQHETPASRREFLRQLGSGLFLTTLGVGLTRDLGLAGPALGLAGRRGGGLDLGRHARLADCLVESSLSQVQPRFLQELRNGTPASDLVAAAALANARAFGGESYDGYHAFMALMPAYQMGSAMKGERAALPVLKVLYRNASFIKGEGHDRSPTLRAEPRELEPGKATEARLLACVHEKDKAGAEATFDALRRRAPEAAVEHLIPVVCQEVDVHRVVLAWRGWDLARLTGDEHARTLMRQSIRQCVDREGRGRMAIRRDLPAVLEESKVLEKPLGRRAVEDAWIERLARQLADANRRDGAAAVAEALGDGVEPEAIGQAVTLASTFLMLRQIPLDRAYKGKPVGSVHGAGTGVHASDTAAAWRGMARFGSTRQRQLALVAAGYHVAGQSGNVAAKAFDYGSSNKRQLDRRELLARLEACVAAQNQREAATAADAWARAGHPLEPALDCLREASVRADGALHAEKYFRTQEEALVGDRPAFRPLHLAALARVCASQMCDEAPGREQALELLRA